MNYWSRSGSLLEFGGFLILCLLWGTGGWLIVHAGFHLKSREKLIAGLAAGFVLFIELSNLLVHVLPMPAAYWASAALLLLAGLGLAWRSGERPWQKFRLQLNLPFLAVLFLVTLGFTLVLRGLGIFDDYYQLPLISVMATGDIPPHFYLNPALNMPYHYGLQVFTAGMVRLGGLFPWSAWDISRALALGFSVVLAWLWIRRLTGSGLAAGLGSVLLLLGGGSRWLLLILPAPVLNAMGAALHMDLGGLRAGGSLLAILTSPWPMDGGGPFPFPFAYANGLLEPLNMSLGATGALWEMTVLLLLLLSGRRKSSLVAPLTLGLLIANLALSAEQAFAIVVAGVGLAVLWDIVRPPARSPRFRPASLVRWGAPLTIAVALALVQGGYITGAFMNVVARLTGRAYPLMTTDYQGFSLRWPLAVPTGHLGPLSLFDLGQVGILVAEAGPAFFLAPVAVGFWLRKIHRKDKLLPGLAAGSLLSFIFPIFFRYGLDFDITRLVGSALWLWYALSFPVLWRWFSNARQSLRAAASLGYGVAIYAGLVMLSVELVAMPVPQLSYYIVPRESEFSRLYWDRLEKGAQVLDSIPQRAVALFGRASYAGDEVYANSASWEALVADPDPAKVAGAGYSYVYMDSRWWNRLTPQQQAAYHQACARTVKKIDLEGRSFRSLFDVKACRAGSVEGPP